MIPIMGILSMIGTATQTISAFKGTPAVAKVTGYVQDAVQVLNSLTPLVTQWSQGTDVSEEDVRVALAGKTAALNQFEQDIAAAKTSGG